MRTFKNSVLVALLLALAPKLVQAQALFHVHEDVVKPSMEKEFDRIVEQINEIARENPVDGLLNLALQGDNGCYYFIRPIANMADLDKSSGVQNLAEKAGNDKVYSCQMKTRVFVSFFFPLPRQRKK